MINSRPVIHWFRRDLRLTDNTALATAAKSSSGIIPVYVLSGWKNAHGWTGPARQEFLCGCLNSLAKNLERIGGRLVIRRGSAVDELERLAVESGATAIFFNRDPDPFGRAMETRVREMATRLGISAHDFKDATVHEREEILTSAGQPYRVFTPYSRAWLKADKPAPLPAIRHLDTPTGISTLPLPDLAAWNLKNTARVYKAGENAARKRLTDFLSGPIFDYASKRDFPDAAATSCLSADLRFGTLSIREIYKKCLQASENTTVPQRKSVFTFVNELAWREFYMQILWHWPEVLEHEFNPKWRGLNWREPGPAFDRWREGTTGFPIVDAAMRQLNATGFMHNRLRMIVAMFLTKDLHIDWRHGERHFMQQLVDGDIAANNGGWQWSAGTGADAAPYFRIQNPWSQTQRYDTDGAFIRKWVPELRDVAPARLMAPPPDGRPLAKNYPTPMVDHAHERDVTLKMYSRE
jgi:deoxyribodipyrimidine photo-lyase